LKTYIRSRRFSQSMTKLAGTRERILEIALAAGFETQESFTRAFKQAFGVTPAHYRKHAGSIAVLPKIRFDQDYLNHLKTGISSDPQIVDQPELRLVGMKTTFYSVDSEKNNLADKLPKLWGEFLPRLGDVPNRIGIGGYGVIQQTPARTDELEYWAAVPVTHLEGSLPKGLLDLRVPSARYARFAHRGQVAAINMTVNYIYSSWLLRSNMRHTYGCDLEFYGDEYIPDSDQSVIYYAIPVG
jgi:AraC family transcriptional regulator